MYVYMCVYKIKYTSYVMYHVCMYTVMHIPAIKNIYIYSIHMHINLMSWIVSCSECRFLKDRENLGTFSLLFSLAKYYLIYC